MKASEQNISLVLFILLSKVVLPLCLWMKSLSVIIQIKATEQNVPGTVYSAVQGGSYFIVHG